MRKMLLLALIVGAAVGAPLPFPKKPASPVGVWMMRHATLTYRAVFCTDGEYLCESDEGRLRWRGTWTMSGHVLRVRECYVGADPEATPMEWSAVLEPGRLRGEYRSPGMGHGPGSFALRAVK